MNSVVINSPVKINLTLDVFPPRDDGYHDLDSVVAVMSYPFDELKVTALPGKRVVRLITKATDIPRDSSNLAVRAAEIFLERFIPGEEVTIWINLAKRLPIQAGLGGGSSDAAATLIALSQIYPDVTSESALIHAAASIGSDVPLFVSVRESGSGIVRLQGRGEIVERISRFPEIFGILVKPAEGVSTASAYAALDAVPHRKSGASTMTLLTAIESMTEGAGLTSYLTNDFDSVIADIVPSINSIFVYLKEAGALAQVLCGSGSCVFGLCRDYAHARELARVLAGRFAWVKITSMPASQTKMPGENAA